MQRRTLLFLLTLVLGLGLAVVSYFFLAAPLGVSADESFSNPRLPFAASLFILGVVITFLSAVVYELIPDRRNRWGQPGR